MIRIYSTLSRTKEEFQPGNDPVTMYVCGMTPKFHPHIGHARCYIGADIIRRHLEYRGYRVRHIQNFTDIDDKIIERAQRERTTPEDVARRYSDSYFEVMDALNIARATEYPTVSGYMPQIIEFVQGLIERGFAYAAESDVYFDVTRLEDYGKLSGRTEESGRFGVRKDLEPGKRNPRDFALWKSAKPGEPSWPSPWGEGRPGWHIECSTMSRESLGDQIDIHSGGQDLIFPHHENEIAQSEALTEKVPFARYWPHVGLVMAGAEKMSHSLENFTTVADILRVYDPVAVRLYLLSTHYRSPLSFGREGLISASRGLERLRISVEGAPGPATPPFKFGAAQTALDAFESAMDDDFNTAAALGHLFDLAREANRLRDEVVDAQELAETQGAVIWMAGLLGLDLAAQGSSEQPVGDRTGEFVDLLLEVRQSLREARHWELADQIRDRLSDLGIVVEDRPQGAVWRHTRPGE